MAKAKKPTKSQLVAGAEWHIEAVLVSGDGTTLDRTRFSGVWTHRYIEETNGHNFGGLLLGRMNEMIQKARV